MALLSTEAGGLSGVTNRIGELGARDRRLTFSAREMTVTDDVE